MRQKLAVVGASGTLKGVYSQGVLSSLEANGIMADYFSCASSSIISCCIAACGESKSMGLEYWKEAATQSQSGDNMGDVVKRSISEYSGVFKDLLLKDESPGIAITVSKVVSKEAADITQGDQAKSFGRKLLVQILRGNSEWVDRHLEPVVFRSDSKDIETLLTPENFDEVAYASTRMLHAWRDPATIDGAPYVDASYTCGCPHRWVSSMGFKKILVIDVEENGTFESLLKKRKIEAGILNECETTVVHPDVSLKDIGVDYLKASISGCETAYEMGLADGDAWVKKHWT